MKAFTTFKTQKYYKACEVCKGYEPEKFMKLITFAKDLELKACESKEACKNCDAWKA